MLQKPGLQVVGAVDVDPAKAGKDVGQVVGLDRDLGISVCPSAGPLLRSGADVVVHSTSSYLADVMDQLTECLEAGLHIISTCEELAYPFRKHPQLSERLDRCAREHKVALLGTGVNPGFAMDKLALTLAAACQQVSGVEVRRVVDASRRRLPLQKKVGAGLTVEEFRAQVAAGILKHHGLPESATMLADSLGLRADRIEEAIEPVIAPKVVRTEFLEVQPGQVAGVHQVARALAGADQTIWLELKMYVGAEESSDSVSIRGVPDLHMSIPGGIHGDLATVAVVVNCIPAMLGAAPGLRTSRDIPMCFFPGLAVTAAAP